MEAVSDPILRRLLQEYNYWKPKLDAGEVARIEFEVRPYMPESKRVTSLGKRDRFDTVIVPR